MHSSLRNISSIVLSALIVQSVVPAVLVRAQENTARLDSSCSVCDVTAADTAKEDLEISRAVAQRDLDDVNKVQAYADAMKKTIIEFGKVSGGTVIDNLACLNG